ncbi:MAG TPA: hypothetical protein H9935_06145 [Candidatus Blautia merdigallinarum]|uniref:Uncharacterized protein n=1 Tax=Candidatus Blautia merdigallinarum TaxID=2838495 RepID=A0A9D2SKG5_9FIRM|nr:hypothetical protein [Candidatus Blautia merdigallinarum]
MRKLFDEETGYLMIDELAMKRDSYGKVLKDNVVTEEELKEQAELVIAYLKKLDQKLDDEEKDMVTDLICEMAVLYEISRLAEI